MSCSTTKDPGVKAVEETCCRPAGPTALRVVRTDTGHAGLARSAIHRPACGPALGGQPVVGITRPSSWLCHRHVWRVLRAWSAGISDEAYQAMPAAAEA
jgi:hypothetical protein